MGYGRENIESRLERGRRDVYICGVLEEIGVENIVI